jgi:Flp pilus assembly protein TadG
MRLMRSLGNHRGTSTLEFVVVLPTLLVIFLASLELSRAWLTDNIVVNAAREGARWGVVTSPTFDNVSAEARATEVLTAANLTAESLSVTCTPPAVNPTPADPCPRDSEVLASVTVNFETVVPLFLPILGTPGSPLVLQETVTMRRE